MQRVPYANAAIWLGYLAVAAATLGSLVAARSWAISELGSPAALAEWQRWRDDETARQGEPSAGVQRRPPKSDQPPTLILLRDHFAAVAVSTLLVTSFLYGFFVVIARGVARDRARPVASAAPDAPRSPPDGV